MSTVLALKLFAERHKGEWQTLPWFTKTVHGSGYLMVFKNTRQRPEYQQEKEHRSPQHWDIFAPSVLNIVKEFLTLD